MRSEINLPQQDFQFLKYKNRDLTKLAGNVLSR